MPTARERFKERDLIGEARFFDFQKIRMCADFQAAPLRLQKNSFDPMDEVDTGEIFQQDRFRLLCEGTLPFLVSMHADRFTSRGVQQGVESWVGIL